MTGAEDYAFYQRQVPGSSSSSESLRPRKLGGRRPTIRPSSSSMNRPSDHRRPRDHSPRRRFSCSAGAGSLNPAGRPGKQLGPAASVRLSSDGPNLANQPFECLVPAQRRNSGSTQETDDVGQVELLTAPQRLERPLGIPSPR